MEEQNIKQENYKKLFWFFFKQQRFYLTKIFTYEKSRIYYLENKFQYQYENTEENIKSIS